MDRCPSTSSQTSASGAPGRVETDSGMCWEPREAPAGPGGGVRWGPGSGAGGGWPQRHFLRQNRQDLWTVVEERPGQEQFPAFAAGQSQQSSEVGKLVQAQGEKLQGCFRDLKSKAALRRHVEKSPGSHASHGAFFL